MESEHYTPGTDIIVHLSGKIIATIHRHQDYRKTGPWVIKWTSGRVDFHNSLEDAKNNALKGA